MQVNQMRNAIAEVYSGEGWLKKVRNMPDDQVIAVYYSFLNKGKFDKPKRETKRRSSQPEQRTEVSSFIPVQMKIDI